MTEELPGQRRDVRLVYLLATLVTTSQGVLELTLPLRLDSLHYPLPLVGGAVAGLGLGQILSRLPGGAWYRVERARRLILVSLIVFSASTAALALTTNWLVVALLVTVHGFAMGLTTTFLLAILIDVRPAGSRVVTTMAWYTAAISTGYAIGSPLAAQTITLWGHGAAFLVSGAVGLVAAGVGPVLRLRIDADGDPPITPGDNPPLARAARAVASLPPAIWLATLAVLYINFISDLVGTFFPIYAVAAGLPLALIGLLKSVNSLAATGIRFAAAGLFRFAPVGPVNQVSVVAMAAAVVGLSLLPSRPLLLVFFAVLGVCRGLIRVTTATAVAEERGRLGSHSGMASGVYNAGLDAGSLLAPPIGGLVAARIGIPSTFRLAAVVIPILYYCVWLFIRARRGDPPGPQTVPATTAE